MPLNARNRHMANRSVKILAVASLFAALVGCSSSSSNDKVGEAPEDASASRQDFGPFEFVLPKGWTKENAAGGLLLMAPEIENNWQANLFLEFRDDPEERTVEQALADVVPNLRDRKKRFREVSRKAEMHPGGFQIATSEYTCADEGAALTEWEIVIRADTKKRLFVLASSASASWAKYAGQEIAASAAAPSGFCIDLTISEIVAISNFVNEIARGRLPGSSRARTSSVPFHMYTSSSSLKPDGWNAFALVIVLGVIKTAGGRWINSFTLPTI